MTVPVALLKHNDVSVFTAYITERCIQFAVFTTAKIWLSFGVTEERVWRGQTNGRLQSGMNLLNSRTYLFIIPSKRKHSVWKYKYCLMVVSKSIN